MVVMHINIKWGGSYEGSQFIYFYSLCVRVGGGGEGEVEEERVKGGIIIQNYHKKSTLF